MAVESALYTLSLSHFPLQDTNMRSATVCYVSHQYIRTSTGSVHNMCYKVISRKHPRQHPPPSPRAPAMITGRIDSTLLQNNTRQGSAIPCISMWYDSRFYFHYPLKYGTVLCKGKVQNKRLNMLLFSGGSSQEKMYILCGRFRGEGDLKALGVKE